MTVQNKKICYNIPCDNLCHYLNLFNKEGLYMKKSYETIVLDILRIEEDVVRCSGEFTYSFGDSVGEDVFD